MVHSSPNSILAVCCQQVELIVTKVPSNWCRGQMFFMRSVPDGLLISFYALSRMIVFSTKHQVLVVKDTEKMLAWWSNYKANGFSHYSLSVFAYFRSPDQYGAQFTKSYYQPKPNFYSDKIKFPLLFMEIWAISSLTLPRKIFKRGTLKSLEIWSPMRQSEKGKNCLQSIPWISLKLI